MPRAKRAEKILALLPLRKSLWNLECHSVISIVLQGVDPCVTPQSPSWAAQTGRARVEARPHPTPIRFNSFLAPHWDLDESPMSVKELFSARFL